VDEYRVKVSVRNNLILSAIESAGYVGHGSQARFCSDCGIAQSALIGLTTLRVSPITTTGEFSTVAKALMEFFGCAPNDLWTNAQLGMRVERSSGEFTISESGLQELMSDGVRAMTLPDPEGEVASTLLGHAVRKILSSGKLLEADRRVLSLRYGLDDGADRSLEEVAQILGVTRERVRQMESRAFRSLSRCEEMQVLHSEIE